MPDASSPALIIDGLVKDVGPVPALDGRMKRVISGLSLTAEFGQVTVLLGLNGAGKTTTLECAQGLQKRQGGKISLLGVDPEMADAALRARVGVMLQDGGLPPALRPIPLLRHVAGMYQDPWPVDELVQLLDIESFASTSIRRLSGGQKQRVALAAALVGRPEMVFLDEPSAGLDPQSRQLVFELIRKLRSDGLAVVLTTHLLDDAQRLADYVYILDDGRTVAEGTVPELLKAADHNSSTRTLTFDATPGLTPTLRDELRLVETRPGSYTVSGPLQSSDLADLAGWWATHQVMPTSINLASRSLEDVFLDIANIAALERAQK
ncbi:ABC transporter ATP-binding protein [Psychromicrobium lacuslunae]|uniref:ABC transporter n=1 Tax=Psychromicrobium lacuslunae TaxID=1618207 RepID=A0A0D4BX24_9MICC|nr:ABC transporter ATP-binding protein [Psychromicrobium lacuslunae]AJT40878.1 ABC transporter [Psychromicrobium lacuslunae]